MLEDGVLVTATDDGVTYLISLDALDENGSAIRLRFTDLLRSMSWIVRLPIAHVEWERGSEG